MKDKQVTLKEIFGHDSFRPLQEEAIDTILQKKDLLMILPTGGGKSLCYQLPSLLMPGVTVVISPLLALMHDQVTALHSLDIAADMITSMQGHVEIEDVYRRLIQGKIKLLYVAPERFTNTRFIDLLSQCEINFFVIDEAHCVSEWGHEFRSDYRKLNLLRSKYPEISIAAFTATATPKVQKDIVANLKLNKPNIFCGPVFRENLEIRAAFRNGDGHDQLLDIIKRHPGDAGIVYCFTRNSTESITRLLQKNGVKARAYHAGLPAQERNQAYHDFVYDEISVIAATIAFGMGIDKSNIRFVVHMSMPKTIENYYQEIGRAGRDGLPSTVYLLHSIADKMQRKALIDRLDESAYKDHAYNQLDQMVKYAVSEKCRHGMLSSYFQSLLNPDLTCATQCDNCQDTSGTVEQKKTNITRQAQMFLSAVYRTEQRFGSTYIIDLLRGSKNKKIIDNRHENLSVYGIGNSHSKPEWMTIAERLQELETLERGEFQELIITPRGYEVLRSNEEVYIRTERLDQSTRQTERQSLKQTKSNTGTRQPSESEKSNFERLKSLRSEIAAREKVPAYIVFNDKTLVEMAEKLPVSKEEMLNIGGVAEKKYERYGKAFIDLCRQLGKKAG
jgi:ATP-dependent DNA helicase RecQ